MSGDRLIVNANASYNASVKVEVLNKNGEPMDGFSEADCDVISGDSVKHTVKWNGNADISSLKDKPIRIKFYLNQSKIYSFTFLQHDT
jgi:hypothetical protein